MQTMQIPSIKGLASEMRKRTPSFFSMDPSSRISGKGEHADISYLGSI
jgi:hypothetical protein